MKSIWETLETFHKSVIISILYCIVSIVICSLLISINTSFLYGALLGTTLLLTSHFVIWVIWYKIPSIQHVMVKTISWLAPLIRIIIYLSIWLLVVLLVNDDTSALTLMTMPINTFVLLIVYTITPFSYGTVIVIDILLEKRGGGK